tara:strand:- start:271 stop:567 length:297 start_codon:yes stop_codon:yes gene_type:complete
MQHQSQVHISVGPSSSTAPFPQQRTNDLSRVSSFLSFFFFFFFCVFIPRGIRRRLGEKKVLFFGAKIFLQSDLSSKKAAKREEFSVTFHKTTKTNNKL